MSSIFSRRQSGSTNGRIEDRSWRFRSLRDTALQDWRWEDRLAVLQSQGVVRLVGCAGRPEPIPDEEIDSLRKLLSNSSKFVCHPYLKEGMLVEVINGPLQGVKGRLIREARFARLVLSITLIQRAVAIEIDADHVAPLHGASFVQAG